MWHNLCPTDISVANEYLFPKLLGGGGDVRFTNISKFVQFLNFSVIFL